MPTIITTPISDMTFRVVPVRYSVKHARQPGRHREQNQQRIDERPELRHQNQVHQHHREDQADAEALKGSVHALDHAAHRDAHAFGQLRLGDDPVDRDWPRCPVLACESRR